MSNGRAIRFGILHARAESWRRWIEELRQAESFGAASIVIPDHFNDQFAAVPALAAAAASTEHIKLAVFMLCNDFRHPAIVAKDAATLAEISGGRLELGLGAGWMVSEYAQLGLPFATAARRIERLAEAVTLVKQLLAGGSVTFTGDHYRVTDLEVIEASRAMPPPLVIGGGGRRVLTLAAREADIISINTNNRTRIAYELHPDISRAATLEKVQWIRDAAGARFDAIELNLTVMVSRVTDDRKDYLARVEAERGVPAPVLADSPFVLVGTTEEIADQVLTTRDELDVSYFTLGAQTFEAFAPVVERCTGA
jgi:probable F420-dependent oxidoreductase